MDVVGVTIDESKKCVGVFEPMTLCTMKQLHAEMGGTETFSESAVSTDLAEITQHSAMAAEL